MQLERERERMELLRKYPLGDETHHSRDAAAHHLQRVPAPGPRQGRRQQWKP